MHHVKSPVHRAHRHQRSSMRSKLSRYASHQRLLTLCWSALYPQAAPPLRRLEGDAACRPLHPLQPGMAGISPAPWLPAPPSGIRVAQNGFRPSRRPRSTDYSGAPQRRASCLVTPRPHVRVLPPRVTVTSSRSNPVIDDPSALSGSARRT